MLVDALRAETLPPRARVLDLCTGSGASRSPPRCAARATSPPSTCSRRAMLSARLNARAQRRARPRACAATCSPPSARRALRRIVVQPALRARPRRTRCRPRGPSAAWDAGRDGRALLDRHLRRGARATCARAAACCSCTPRSTGRSGRATRWRRGGPRAAVVQRRRGPLGPLMAGRAGLLEDRGPAAPAACARRRSSSSAAAPRWAARRPRRRSRTAWASRPERRSRRTRCGVGRRRTGNAPFSMSPERTPEERAQAAAERARARAGGAAPAGSGAPPARGAPRRRADVHAPASSRSRGRRRRRRGDRGRRASRPSAAAGDRSVADTTTGRGQAPRPAPPQLPGGGRRIFPDRRVVAFYGNPQRPAARRAGHRHAAPGGRAPAAPGPRLRAPHAGRCCRRWS